MRFAWAREKRMIGIFHCLRCQARVSGRPSEGSKYWLKATISLSSTRENGRERDAAHHHFLFSSGFAFQSASSLSLSMTMSTKIVSFPTILLLLRWEWRSTCQLTIDQEEGHTVRNGEKRFLIDICKQRNALQSPRVAFCSIYSFVSPVQTHGSDCFDSLRFDITERKVQTDLLLVLPEFSWARTHRNSPSSASVQRREKDNPQTNSDSVDKSMR